MEAVVKV